MTKKKNTLSPPNDFLFDYEEKKNLVATRCLPNPKREKQKT
jgi:hypothetical protein